MNFFKKMFAFLLLIFTICTSVIFAIWFASTMDILPKENRLEKSRLETKTYNYPKEVHQQQNRKNELKEKLKNPDIILEKFQEVGKIISYEGKVRYPTYIKEEGLLGKLSTRELYIDLTYKFGISMDLENIKIIDVINTNTYEGTKVILEIPKNKLQLEYLELVLDDKSIQSDKTILTSQFKPEDINMILQISKDQVEQKINNTDEIFYQARENLKTEIAELIFNLGFDSVEFK